MAQVCPITDPISLESAQQESGNQICRFCLENSEDYINLTEKCGEEISTFLQKYHSITINHCDAWPKSACLSCVGRITSFRTLCDTIRSSEQTLKEVFGDSDIKSIKKEEQEEEEEEEEEVLPESFWESLTEIFPASSPATFPEPTIKRELPDDKQILMIQEFFSMTCDLCKKDFTKCSELRLHMRLEHKKRWYIRCCKAKYRDKKSMLEHLKYHTNPDAFKCHHCQRQFTNQEAVSMHIANCHMPDKRVFVCDICKKTFAAKSILRGHIEQSHLKLSVGRRIIPENSLAKPIKKCICEICGKAFDRGKKLTRHSKTHITHLGPDGTPQLPFKCDECGLVYKYRWGLTNHRQKHEAYGKYKCKECGKVSPNSSALRKHIKDSHIQTRSFICHICHKGFKRGSVLKEHVATHTGAYLYTCDFCPKEFRAGATKSLHIRREHPEMRKRR